MLRLPICIRSYIQSSWANISIVDCPTPIEFMGIHLIHRIAQLLWAWTHNSSMGFSKFDWFVGIHLTYKIVHNCTKFHLILWRNWILDIVYYVFTIPLFLSFGIVFWIAKMIQISGIRAKFNHLSWIYKIKFSNHNPL